MRIGFRELFQLGLVVNVGIGNFEGTGSRRDVGLDIADTRNFGKIASDRGGTGTSEHVGHFEADERERRTSLALCRCRCLAAGIRQRLGLGRASDHCQKSQLNHDR